MNKLFRLGLLVLIGFIAGVCVNGMLYDPIECDPKPLISHGFVKEEKQVAKTSECAVCECENTITEPKTESKDELVKNLSSFQNMVVDSRMRVVGRFFDLSEVQKEQLRGNFKDQVRKKRFDKESAYRALSEVLGSDEAAFFRKKQKETFERVKQKAASKETVYLSRILNLTPDQEEQIEGIYLDLEDRVQRTMTDLIEQGELDDNELFHLSTQSKIRRDLLSESFQSILNEPQYQSYMDYESQSLEAETELWH